MVRFYLLCYKVICYRFVADGEYLKLGIGFHFESINNQETNVHVHSLLPIFDLKILWLKENE